jgi:hypothetical protein
MLGTAQAAVDPLGHEREERGEKERGGRKASHQFKFLTSHSNQFGATGGHVV